MIEKTDLIRALDHAVPYPNELDPTLKDYMADRLMEMCLIEKNPDHSVWQVEIPEPPGEEVESGTGMPTPNP